MAPRKAKSTATAPKVRASGAGTSPRTSRQGEQSSGGGDSNRLLREAAWNRMFGRIETKNPFTR